MANFQDRLRSHVLSVNSSIKNANTCKYGSLTCFVSGNSILILLLDFKFRSKGTYTLGNWNDEYMYYDLALPRSIDFFTGVEHQH